MNSLQNNVTLVGHLGDDPEVKTLESGKSLTRIRLATNEYYTNKDGERVTSTQWHTCVGWGRTGERMGQLLRKGKQVMLQGRLQYRSFEDKDGAKRNIPEVIVQGFSLIGKKDSQ